MPSGICSLKSILPWVLVPTALATVVFNIYSPTEASVSTHPVEQAAPQQTTGTDKRLDPIPDFSAIEDPYTKKVSFFEFLRPLIAQRNREIAEQRQWLLALQTRLAQGGQLSEADQLSLQNIASQYRLDTRSISQKNIAALLKRVDVIPAEMVLVQAANESAWGTSRFAREGRNFFGQWCFRRGCGLVPKHREEGATHEVASFNSAAESVRAYFHNLNTNGSYKLFREIRQQLREINEPLHPHILVTGLINYSARQLDYVTELSAMLRHNRKLLKG